MKPILLLFLFISCFQLSAQFTSQDTLRGSITAERAWWDLEHYELFITVHPETKTISGTNVIRYGALESGRYMQIDLQDTMEIIKVYQYGKNLTYEKKGYSYIIDLGEKQAKETHSVIAIDFEGKPKISKMPPWDGGLTWTKDSEGNHFIATSCQGEGASLWWPCKDHMYDEPDSMLMHVTVPADLVNVSNGRLRSIVDNNDETKTYTWAVVNPINNYGVNINVAKYAHFNDVYDGEKGKLDLDYWVLEPNLKKAKKQFLQVPMMMEAFEHWFGPYPFYEDGYKLVETPYLGMEHQSSVTYGNGYENGYRGRDLSRTGWGKKFDFIIIHESGHEWFANSITYKDMADMWIHESFTAYSEGLYLDYHFGKKAAAEYVIGTRANIENDRPIIGKYNVNHSGSGDMYYKGANMLHMIRTLINDDQKWREILRGLNETFYHQTVTTKQIEDYLILQSDLDLQPIFDQYLRTVEIPILKYYMNKDKMHYRYENCVPDFQSPVEISNKTELLTLTPTTDWQVISIQTPKGKWKVDKNYYIEIAAK